jgi:hypothetical protein
MRIKNRDTSRILAISIASLIILYVLLINSAPFNVKKIFNSNNTNTLELTPSGRVKKVGNNSIQNEDLIYFNSRMQYKYDQAKVKLTFKNPYPDQRLVVGYKDQSTWHYNTQILDDPILDSLQWHKVGSGPYLYQKNSNYISLNNFVKNPPQNKIVGIKDYRNTDILLPNTSIPNYRPSASNISINTPLRGKTTLYAYLNNEPFFMSFSKRDLNWQDDPDTVKITIYKDNDTV